MNTLYSILFGAIILLLFSCGSNRQYFTQRMKEGTYWTESEWKQIQFYTTGRIVLQQELTGRKSDIEEGEIRFERGRKIRQIIIPAGTPGAYVFSPDGTRFAISFDENDDHFLMFGPNPRLNSRYTLLASDWERDRGIVSYRGEKWWTTVSSASASLTVDVKEIGHTESSQTILRGRRVD